jgi:WD40 repeat protein
MRIIQSDVPRPLDLLAVGPNGLVAAACGVIGVGGDVEVWTVVTGGVQRRGRVSNREARGLAFTPDGQFLLAAGPEDVTVVNLDTGKTRQGPPLKLQYPELSFAANDGRLLVTEAHAMRGRVAAYAVEEGPAFRPLWSEGPSEQWWFKIPAVSADGSRVAFARRGSRTGGETLDVLDAATGRVVSSVLGASEDPAYQIALSADGSRLFVRPNGRAVRVYDAASGEWLGELVHPGRPYVTAVAAHPAGPVACARTNGTVTLWNPETCEVIHTLDRKAGKLVSVAFSPDGALGAAGTEDGKLVVWDVDV